MENRSYEVWDNEGEEEELWTKFRRFAISYKKAFQALIENEMSDASKGHSYNDEDILPALHLFHHYLELSFKCLLDKAGKSLNTHLLKVLLSEVEKEYPDFNLSELPKKLITDNDLINDERPLLDLERFRYPADTKGINIWVTKGKRGAFINLKGVYTSSNRLISEIEEYFKKEIFRLPIKPFYTSNKPNKLD